MLKSIDFSVVVQGPIHSSPEHKGERDVTIRCLKSIRTFLPDAEIVLSTWESENTEGLDYNVLIKSVDPKTNSSTTRNANAIAEQLSFTNVDRQIVSTRAGLEAATRPYAIKFRGDLLMESDALLRHPEFFDSPGTPLFQGKVLITPYFTKNPRTFPSLFHYSDIVQVGRTEDLRKIWSAPLTFDPETTRLAERDRDHYLSPWRQVPPRLLPEQFIIFSFLEKGGHRSYVRHPFLVTPRKILLSEELLLKSFRVVAPAQLGVRLRDDFVTGDPRLFYLCSDWERLTRAYAHPVSRWASQVALLLQTYMAWSQLLGSSFLRALKERQTTWGARKE